MTVFYFLFFDKRDSQIAYNPKFSISLTSVYVHYFGRWAKVAWYTHTFSSLIAI
jgi:hypothetical protein